MACNPELLSVHKTLVEANIINMLALFHNHTVVIEQDLNRECLIFLETFQVPLQSLNIFVEVETLLSNLDNHDLKKVLTKLNKLFQLNGAILIGDSKLVIKSLKSIILDVVGTSGKVRNEYNNLSESKFYIKLQDIIIKTLHDLSDNPDKFDITTAIEKFKSIHIFYSDMSALKQINDTLSHEAGDKAIYVTLDTLSKNLNMYATEVQAYEFGGDEFTFICVGKQTVDAIQIKKNFQLNPSVQTLSNEYTTLFKKHQKLVNVEGTFQLEMSLVHVTLYDLLDIDLTEINYQNNLLAIFDYISNTFKKLIHEKTTHAKNDLLLKYLENPLMSQLLNARRI